MNLGAYQSWDSQTLPVHKAPVLVFFCEHRATQDFDSNKEQPRCCSQHKDVHVLMDVTHIVLLSPASQSRLRNSVRALWLHPLCHAKCDSTLHPTVYVLSDGQELQRQSQTGAMAAGFQPACRCGAGSARVINGGSLKAVWAIKHAQSTENP